LNGDAGVELHRIESLKHLTDGGICFENEGYRSLEPSRRISARDNKIKKGELNMAEQEEPQCHFLAGLLIGGVLGALAGIFFAPKSGKELRSDIKEKGSEVLKDAKEIYADASTKAKDLIDEIKHQVQELKKEAEGAGEKIADEVQEKIGQVKKVLGK
jgi:gas vesicle protein